MINIDEVRRELAVSSDAANPSAEELVELLQRVERIAVIGLSRHPQKAARRVPSFLAASGYDVIPVNPYATRIFGREAYPTITDVPEPVELVVIFRPTGEAGPFVTESLARPDRPAMWLQQGIRADQEVAEAREQGVLAVQDLCIFRVKRHLE